MANKQKLSAWSNKSMTRPIRIFLLLLVFHCPRLSLAVDGFPALVEKLANSGSFKVRLKAAVLLGRLNDVRAVKPLVLALGDENYVVRGSAARALGNLGLPKAVASVEPLFAQLLDEEHFVQQETRRALRRLAGLQSLDSFIAALDDRHPSVRLTAFTILSSLNIRKARLALTSVLGDTDERVLGEVLFVFKGMGQSDLDVLLRRALLHSDNPRVQKNAARLAGELQLGSTMDLLADLLISHGGTPDLRQEASLALAAMKVKMDVPALALQAKSEDRSARNRAIVLLGLHGGEQAVEVLVSLLGHADSMVRRRTVFALGDSRNPSALPALRRLRQAEDDKRLRQIIERTIRKIESFIHPGTKQKS
jgi:HEAT repeat protein